MSITNWLLRMPEPKQDKRLAQLFRLLDREREILISGDLTQLTGAVKEKERILDMLNAKPGLSKIQIHTVQVALKRNQVLLQQAGNGIKSASKRLREPRSRRCNFRSYTKEGEALTFSSTKFSRIKKIM